MAAFNDFDNPQVKKLPNHLRQFIVEQHYEHYTPVDQAVWRYVMRQNYSYLKDVAYYPYIPGLEAAGLTIEKIPDLREMNQALKKIGWGAVTVDGFIPPSAFMEYQSYRVLVIAADIRQLHHIEYTPAPDIIHESAGHAPIIADKDYHEYLSYFGSIGAKAMFSSKDFELYEAIRELSILKEMPEPEPLLLRKAEKRVDFCQKNLGDPSEMALLSRLHWWTVEYGLIGTPENPKIYGAGLLSSIGESKSCMDPAVKKYRYSLDAINFPFDITQTQPQLFVTPDFQTLIKVLEEFADTMSFRRGGSESLLKAIECKNVCTAEFSSGLQLSGIFCDMTIDKDDEVRFIRTSGGTALAFGNQELPRHGKSRYENGFASPVGPVKGMDKPLEDASGDELASMGLVTGNIAELAFDGGITLKGMTEHIDRREEKVVLISFTDCTITDENQNVIFRSGTGIFDLPVGERIVSVYSGAADKDAFEEHVMVSKTATFHPVYDEKVTKYHQLFQVVRNCRENHGSFDLLPVIWRELQKNYREDWLCALEILEILENERIFRDLAKQIQIFLEIKANAEPEFRKLITDGFYLIKHPVDQLTN